MPILNKEEVASKILKSRIFLKAPTSSALLQYLVKAEKDGSYLKENIIDFEFFGGDSKFDKSNARVRVNIYNLRKKIDDYYKIEGLSDSWRIQIDKGQYSIRYVETKRPKKQFSKINFKIVLPYFLLFFFSALFIYKCLPPKKPLLWNNYLENQFTTTLFIGDAFGLKGMTITGSEGFTRDYAINSEADYYQFIEAKPEFKELVKPADYSYITGMGAIASNNISRLFAKYQKGFEIRFASNTSIADLKAGNTIYVGPFKNEDKFITIFNNSNTLFKLSKTELKVPIQAEFKDSIIQLNNVDPDTEFAIVSRFKSNEDKEQFMFFSNHDIGVLATIEFFTNEDSLKVFTKKYLKDKKNFTAVYKVLGKNRTNLDLKTVMVVPF